MTQITKDNSELIAFCKKWENLIPIYISIKRITDYWHRASALEPSERERALSGVLALHKQPSRSKTKANRSAMPPSRRLSRIRPVAGRGRAGDPAGQDTGFARADSG